jgi:hypothetical protein
MPTSGFDTGKAVRMTRAGNSRMLPVPAEIVRQIGADLGDEYVVQVVGDDVVYHRQSSVRSAGRGRDRVGVLSSGGATFVGNAPSVGLLDDWDF